MKHKIPILYTYFSKYNSSRIFHAIGLIHSCMLKLFLYYMKYSKILNACNNNRGMGYSRVIQCLICNKNAVYLVFLKTKVDYVVEMSRKLIGQ